MNFHRESRPRHHQRYIDTLNDVQAASAKALISESALSIFEGYTWVLSVVAIYLMMGIAFFSGTSPTSRTMRSQSQSAGCWMIPSSVFLVQVAESDVRQLFNRDGSAQQ